MEAGAGRRLFGVITCEGLEFQASTFANATVSGFIDDAEAAGVDVVDAASNIVVATDRDFLGGVGGWVMDALDFVLLRGGAFDPGAAEFAFDGASAFALDAASGADIGLVVIDGAFVDDLVFEVAITIVQAFAVADAAGGFDGVFLAADAGAVEKVFARFDGIASAVALAVFHATSLHQLAATIGGFLADVDAIVLVDLLLLGDAFAGFDASVVDGDQLGFGAGSVGFACEEVLAILPGFRGLVLLTVLDATSDFEGQTIAASEASAAVVRVVVVTTDGDAGKIFGDASFGHEVATLADVDQTAAFDFGSIGVSTRTTTVIGLSGQSQDGGSAQKEQSHRDDLHDDHLNSE